MTSDAAPARRALLLNGPNLNLLGRRDPAQYGTSTLADAEALATATGARLGLDVQCRQSNHEGVLIDLVQAAPDEGFAGIVINPGAYAHYSYALRDAVDAVAIPCVEIHISNVHAREPFRHVSVTAPVMAGFICGCGVAGYEFAVRALASRLSLPAQGAAHPGDQRRGQDPAGGDQSVGHPAGPADGHEHRP